MGWRGYFIGARVENRAVEDVPKYSGKARRYRKLCFDLALLAQSESYSAVCEIGSHHWISDPACEAVSSYKLGSTLWTSVLCMGGADMQSSLLMLNGMRTTIPDYEGTMEHALEYIAPGSKIYTCLGMETRCSRIVSFDFECDAE